MSANPAAHRGGGGWRGLRCDQLQKRLRAAFGKRGSLPCGSRPLIKQPLHAGGHPVDVPEFLERGCEAVEHGAHDCGGRGRRGGTGVDQICAQTAARRVPSGGLQNVGRGVQRVNTATALVQRGHHQRAGEPGDGDGAVDVQLDIGRAYLQRRVVVGQPGVPVQLAPVGYDAGGQQSGHLLFVVRGAGEERWRAADRPAAENHGAPAREPGVPPFPERGVGAQGHQHRQPGSQPAERGGTGLTVGHGDMDMHAADQLLVDQPCGLCPHVPIALVRGDRHRRRTGQRRAAGRREPAVRVASGATHRAPEPGEMRGDLLKAGTHRRGDLHLRLQQFGVDVLPPHPGLAPRRGTDLSDARRRQSRLPIEQQELFFDAERHTCRHSDGVPPICPVTTESRFWRAGRLLRRRLAALDCAAARDAGGPFPGCRVPREADVPGRRCRRAGEAGRRSASRPLRRRGSRRRGVR